MKIGRMPIFSKKFDVKNIPVRSKRQNDWPKIQEKLDDYQIIQLNLDEKKLKFVNGTWTSLQNSTNPFDVGVMKRKIQKLEEENNLNQIKVDVLLDMLTENLAELSVIHSK